MRLGCSNKGVATTLLYIHCLYFVEVLAANDFVQKDGGISFNPVAAAPSPARTTDGRGGLPGFQFPCPALTCHADDRVQSERKRRANLCIEVNRLLKY